MLQRQTSMVALLICSSMLAACGEDTGKKRVASTSREDAEDGEKAVREAEAKLMSDPTAAVAALEQRVAEWFEVRGGLIMLQGGTTTWQAGRKRQSKRVPLYAMPATTPWYVKCDAHGLEVTLGPWPTGRVNSGEDEERDAAFSAELTYARLNSEQCKAMVPVVGRKLLVMTR
jgi:hypothetical protein